MYGRHGVRMTIATAFAVIVSSSTLLAASPEESYFQGKTVRFTVGYSPGGGYDIYARMLAPYYKKYFGANVVVENRPGAGGITARNATYQAPPDGLTMMIVKGSAAIMAQITDEPAVRYDMSKFGYLGGTGASAEQWLVTPNSPIKTFADVKKSDKTMIWAATGPMDGLSDGALMTCKALQIKCKVLMGFPGTSDAALALARGEADAMIINDSTSSVYVANGNARAIATMFGKRSRFFQDLPTIYEAASLSDEDKWWLDLRIGVNIMGRVIVVPPNMPPERLKYMQDVSEKVMTDPAVVAEGEKTKRYIEYQSAEEMRLLANKLVGGISIEEKKRVRDLMLN